MYIVEIDIVNGWNAMFTYKTLEECLLIMKLVIEQGYEVKVYFKDGEENE